MTSIDTSFTGSVPDIYERLMVPMIFSPYAEDLAQRVMARSPRRILETAAGTGAVTRVMARHLPHDGAIAALDLNAPMLACARRLVRDPRVVWHEGDAQNLPFAAGHFDCVACQFGVMFFPDKARAYGEARRVLAEGGAFLFNVWGPLADNHFVAVLDRALAQAFPDDPSGFMARIPHGYHNTAAIAAALTAAGFRKLDCVLLETRSQAASALHAATGYCQGTPLRAEIEQRGHDLNKATDLVARALEQEFGSGPIAAPISAYVFEASL